MGSLRVCDGKHRGFYIRGKIEKKAAHVSGCREYGLSSSGYFLDGYEYVRIISHMH